MFYKIYYSRILLIDGIKHTEALKTSCIAEEISIALALNTFEIC